MTYLNKLKSKFYGIMQWQDCNDLFTKLIANPQNWYIYDINRVVPTDVLTVDEFIVNISAIHNIIKEQHQERYCGIVYTDDLKTPTMIKIFHPNNLGKSCGSSENPPLPQWIVSKLSPVKIEQAKVKENQGFISKFFTK